MPQAVAINIIDDDQDDMTLAMTTHVRLGELDLFGEVDEVEARVIEHLVSRRIEREIRGYRWSDIKPRLTAVITLARLLGPLKSQAVRVDA